MLLSFVLSLVIDGLNKEQNERYIERILPTELTVDVVRTINMGDKKWKLGKGKSRGLKGNILFCQTQ